MRFEDEKRSLFLFFSAQNLDLFFRSKKEKYNKLLSSALWSRCRILTVFIENHRHV